MTRYPLLVAHSLRSLITTSMMLVGVTLTTLHPAQVFAVPMYTVTPNPLALSVLEEQSGVFDFTVKNVGAEDLTITDITKIILSIPSDRDPAQRSISYLSGDKHDEVFNTQLVISTCKGKTLSTNGTCVFQQLFQTRDLNKAASGTNVGIWEISNAVFASEDFFEVGEATVEVRDPGAATTIPEPSTLFLFGSGVVGIASLTRKKRIV